MPDTWTDWNQCLLQIEDQPLDTTIAPSPAVDQWIDVFTDGSCLWPRNKFLRLASWAVVQAHHTGDPCKSQVVMAGAVPGLLQSAHRAELLAVLQSLRYARVWGLSLRIWSDCEAVVSRVRKILAFHEPPKINSAHADLWMEVYSILSEWNFQKLQITKVAAHQDLSEPQGALEQWAFAHNSLADRAARLANVQRPSQFWDAHRRHAIATEHAAFVSKTLNIAF